MLMAEFAKQYDPEHSAVTDYPPGLREPMTSSQDWSMRIGSLLHGRLLGLPLPDDAFSKTMNGYYDWLADEFGEINEQVTADTSPSGLSASNELNFHRLSLHTIYSWPFALVPEADDDSFPTRAQIIKYSQYKLACAGIDYCLLRAATSEIGDDYQYLHRDNNVVRVHHEALMTEFDAGAILMGIARQRAGITVVPAPAQFSRSKRKAVNVNWIVIDQKNGRAAGVQVKSHVSQEVRSEYDDDVVLLDSDYDIGNGIFHRDTPGTTREKRYVWGGLICAQVLLVDSLGQQSKDMLRLRSLGIDKRHLLRNRQLAQQVAGKHKIKLTDSIHVVGQKVAEKL